MVEAMVVGFVLKVLIGWVFVPIVLIAWRCDACALS